MAADMVVILNGRPRVGKDELARLMMKSCARASVSSYLMSSVDRIKEIAKEMGWDGQKDMKSRKLLADLKNLSTWYNDGPMNEIASKIADIPQGLLLVMVREPHEIRRVMECARSHGAHTLAAVVVRSEVEQESYGNPADDGIFDMDYDLIVENNDSLDDLDCLACDIIEKWTEGGLL